MNRKQRRAAARKAAKGQPTAGRTETAARHAAEGFAAVLSLGQQLHVEGRLEAADRYYAQALQLEPTDSDALRLRGALMLQRGRPADAVPLLQQAAARLPKSAEVHLHLGAAHEAAGAPEAAERAYRQALAVDPDHAEGLNHLGAFLRLAGRNDEAEAILRRALDAGEPPAAAPAYHLGTLLLEAGRYAEARDMAEFACKQAPADADCLGLLGLARQRAGDADGAEEAFRAAMEAAPADPTPINNLAALLIARERLDEAEDLARRAVAAAPESRPARLTLATVLSAAERFAEAEAIYHALLDAAPEDADILGNLANMLAAAGRTADALVAYREAHRLAPDAPRHAFQLALALLAAGELSEAWPLYESGFACGERGPARGDPDQRWDGAPDPTGLLHLWPEQGVGDEIRLAGCLREAAQRFGGRTRIECDPRLVPLVARSFPDIEVVPTETADISTATRHAPIGSLPGLLRPDASAFPDHAGYLVPDPERVAQFRARLDALGPGSKVGIAWRSGLMTARRQGAHAPLTDWAPVLTQPGLVPVALQYGEIDAECRAAEAACGVAPVRLDGLDLRGDLDDVAALMAALDLVIATGSAVGDLAGAVGAPLWSLLRAQDWVQLGRPDHPWYPRARIFERPAGTPWSAVLAERVAPALADHISGANGSSTRR